MNFFLIETMEVHPCTDGSNGRIPSDTSDTVEVPNGSINSPPVLEVISNYLEGKKDHHTLDSLSRVCRTWHDTLLPALDRLEATPTEIRPNGEKIWKRRGMIHRDKDRPAIVYPDGSKIWYQNGLIHRDNDLPAMEGSNGIKTWFQHGIQHRDDDKPAFIGPNGVKWWYKDGMLHREGNRPAIISPAYVGYYFNDQVYYPIIRLPYGPLVWTITAVGLLIIYPFISTIADALRRGPEWLEFCSLCILIDCVVLLCIFGFCALMSALMSRLHYNRG